MAFSTQKMNHTNDKKMPVLKLSTRQKPCSIFIKAKAQLYSDLKAWGLLFKPHFWFEREWYCPDACAGIAVPLWFASDDLFELSQENLLQLEGKSYSGFLSILRHETGHAFENAYAIRRKKQRQLLFGKSSSKYPSQYSPNPLDKKHIRHLNDFYAQAHPDEDFAESFAKLLRWGPNWRKYYQRENKILGYHSIVFEKLVFIESLFLEFARTKVEAKYRFIGPSVNDYKKPISYFISWQQKREQNSVQRKALSRELKNTLLLSEIKEIQSFERSLKSKSYYQSPDATALLWSWQHLISECRTYVSQHKAKPAEVQKAFDWKNKVKNKVQSKVQSKGLQDLLSQECFRYLRKGAIRFNI